MSSRPDSIETVLRELPFWDRLTDDEKALVSRRSSIRKFDRKAVISSTDTSCMGIVCVLSGGVRVSLLSEEGREITLYRIGPGDCCVTTASCVIRQITFDTLVSAAEETSLLVVPSPVCSFLADSNIYVRAFLYETETERFSQAIWVIQQILFKRLDQRLAAYLIEESQRTGSPDLSTTQEEIAQNINSAREAVARMLRQFVSDGLVGVRRGHILLLDPDGLRSLM